MRILMLGNSFTYFNDLPVVLAGRTGAEVTAHTRGGARLAEHLNPDTEMGRRTQAALAGEPWDYVILQEMSSGPITARAAFLRSVSALAAQARGAGATPLLYATWAYQRGGAKLAAMAMSCEEMTARLSEAYRAAAEETGALVAEVGRAFLDRERSEELYASDGYHPNRAGTALAAEIIAAVIAHHQAEKKEE